jgi:hypothetical protein
MMYYKKIRNKAKSKSEYFHNKTTNHKKDLNFFFQRYQDENSWFDFDRFYMSLKAKNLKDGQLSVPSEVASQISEYKSVMSESETTPSLTTQKLAIRKIATSPPPLINKSMSTKSSVFKMSKKKKSNNSKISKIIRISQEKLPSITSESQISPKQ